MKFLLLALLSLSASAADYVMPNLTTYAVQRVETDEYPGYFADEIHFHSSFTGWALIEVIANDKSVSCGRRCTFKVPSIAFDAGELVNQYCFEPYDAWQCQDTPLYPVDFVKQFAYQHTGHQLMLPYGWRLYLIPGDYTLYVWGTAQFPASSYRVQVKPAQDPNGED